MHRWAGSLAALLAGILLATSCRRDPLVWERLDLRGLAPVATSGPGILGESSVFLGPEDVRDPDRVPAWSFAQVRRVSAGQSRALSQRPGSRASWLIPAGRDRYLSVTPISGKGCQVEGRILVEGREALELWRGTLVEPTPFAPETLELALPTGASHLVLEAAAANDACRAEWVEAALQWRRPEPRRGVERPNVILIGLDTVRADALGPWGRRPSLTPAIDRLAESSDVYLEAFASANATNPSFASLLTGLAVKNHGVVDLAVPLPDGHPTLASRLGAAGWESLAVLAAGHVPPALSAGFEQVMGPPGTFAGQTAVDLAIEWLGAARERPVFLWLHLFDPHTPHTPPRAFAEGRRPARPFGFGRIEEWAPFRETGPAAWTEPVLGASRELYDAEIAYTDRQLDRFLGWLESRRWLEDTLLVVVADHGENVGDHGIEFRHAGLWDSTIHVPLLVRQPGPARAGRRLVGLVQHYDVTATILDVLGLPYQELDAQPLAELIASGGRRAVFAEHSDAAGASIRTRSHALIRLHEGVSFAPAGTALYDLVADPRQERNLAGRGLPVEASLTRALDAWLADRRGSSGKPRELSEEEESELRALGYL